jgi:hypothetical protein
MQTKAAQSSERPDCLLILEGLFLIDWTPKYCDIYIPAVSEHRVEVATTPDLKVSARVLLPAARDYTITGLLPGGFRLSDQFHQSHFAFKAEALSITTDQSNPHAIIRNLPRPVAVHGDLRFEVDQELMLTTTPPSVLHAPSPKLQFCERTILEFKTDGPVALKSLEGSYSPVSINGRQVIGIYSRPKSDAHPGHGADAFNELMRLTSNHRRPAFAMTALTAKDVKGKPSDNSVAAFELPSVFGAQIDGLGCGGGSRGGP